MIQIFLILCGLCIVYFVCIRPFLNQPVNDQNSATSGRTDIEEEDLRLPPKKMRDQERIHRLAQSDPERAKDLIRRWLNEDK